MTDEETLQYPTARWRRIRELVYEAVELGATLDEIETVCKGNPSCEEALQHITE